MDTTNPVVPARERLAAKIEAAKQEGRSYALLFISEEPTAGPAVDRTLDQLDDELDSVLTQFDNDQSQTSEYDRLHVAELVVGRVRVEHVKRVNWHLLAAEGERDPSLDVSAEHALLCAKIDQVWSETEAALIRLHKLFREALDKMTKIARDYMA